MLKKIKKKSKKRYKKYYVPKNQYKLKHGISISSTKKYQTEMKRKHRKNNPEKQKARSMVTVALSRGELKRGSCILCNKKKAESHHINYKKPFNLVWLCRKHHLYIHKLLRAIKKEMGENK